MVGPGAGPGPDGGWRPVPDPTVLTTELIDRAAAAQRDWVLGELAVLRARLDGDDTATNLRLMRLDHIPKQIESRVDHLAALLDVQLERISQQFVERDVRSERESRDNKVAVDAAFAAQKEAAAKQDEANNKAIDKSEKATTETINKLAELFATSNKSLDDKLSEVARRVDRIEGLAIGTQAGSSQAKDTQLQNRTLVTSVIMALLAVIAIVASIIAATSN